MVTTEEFLEHFGVKGMRWGIRKPHVGKLKLGSQDQFETQRQTDRAQKRQKKDSGKQSRHDKKWERKNLAPMAVIGVYNNAVGRFNKELPSINNSPSYKGKNLFKDPALRAKYDKEVLSRFNKHLVAAAASQGTNPSGTKKLTAIVHPTTGAWHLQVVGTAKHDSVDTGWEIKVTRDTNGLITDLSIPNMAQSTIMGQEFLEHHGVKGMKWGIRNKRKHGSDKQGSGPPHAGDLSDEELRRHIERMDLEQRYTKLAHPQKGKNPAAAFIKEIGKNVARTAITTAATAQVGKIMTKAVAK